MQSQTGSGSAEELDQDVCQLQLPGPAFEVGPVEPLTGYADDSGGVVTLAGRAGLAGPLELGEDHVLGSGEPRVDPEDSGRLAAVELAPAESSRLSHDQAASRRCTSFSRNL